MSFSSDEVSDRVGEYTTLGAKHAKEATRLIVTVEGIDVMNQWVVPTIATAQVHALLAKYYDDAAQRLMAAAEKVFT